MPKRSVIVLSSGGIDSSALTHFYKKNNEKVIAVHFQYGQPAARMERLAVGRVSRHYGARLLVRKLGFRLAKRSDEFLNRNALFVFGASAMGLGAERVALGIHSGIPYYDCTPRFLEDCQKILDGYFAGTVRVEAPFREFSKVDIFDYSVKSKVPISLTYSCERSNKPCGKCLSCANRERYFGKGA